MATTLMVCSKCDEEMLDNLEWDRITKSMEPARKAESERWKKHHNLVAKFEAELGLRYLPDPSALATFGKTIAEFNDKIAKEVFLGGKLIGFCITEKPRWRTQ